MQAAATSTSARSRQNSLPQRPSAVNSSSFHSTEGSSACFIGQRENKHTQFRHSHGAKLHPFPRSEVPWPFQYNRETLEQSVMDHTLLTRVRDSQIFVDSGGKTPRRCLDLGTTLGAWVIDAAKQSPESTFVGFDLMDIQISLDFVDPSVAKRIEWVHGNFLYPLPFADNEFDYIHAAGIALAVPENKWNDLFDELNRILTPGGIVEITQQDALFPVLPRWFTGPLHAHLEQHTVDLPDGARPAFISPSHVTQRIPHAHALLEELFYSVFESRFINPKPSSILPGYFLTSFRQVVSPPILRFPMPPIAPLIPKMRSMSSPLPSPSSPSFGEFPAASETTSDPLNPWTYFIPNTAACSLSLDTASTFTMADTDSRSDSTLMMSIIKELGFPSYFIEPQQEPKPQYTFQMLPERVSPLERTHSLPSRIPPSSSSASRMSIHRSRTTSNASSLRRPPVSLSCTETTQLGGDSEFEMFRVDRLLTMGDDSLFMHLYQASQMVYSCTEAMWDELRERVDRKDPTLEVYGWGGEDYVEEASRAKFDGLVERYKYDMRIRLSLWHTCAKHGWSLPRRAPLSAAELVQEDHLRTAILEARQNATEEEFNTPVRSFRLLIGVKSS